MAAGHPRKFMRLKGKLCKAPTSLSATAFPHGGTALGTVADARFEFGIRGEEVHAEEFGSAVVDFIRAGDRAVFLCILREYDSDVVSTIFPNTVAGASSGKQKVVGRVSEATTGATAVKAGALASDNSVALYLSPDSPEHHFGLYIPIAIPLVAESAALQFKVGVESGIAMVFHASPDSDGRLYELGLPEDLNL